MTFSEWTRSKNPILALMMGIMTMPAWAVGTVNQSLAQIPGSTSYVFTENWIADAANGSVPATVMLGTSPIQGFRIISVEIAPGSPAPTNNYTVTITDFSGADVLAGSGGSQSNTTAGVLPSLSNAPPIYGSLTVNVTGNVVNSAQGRILVYFAPISQIVGNTSGGPTLTGNNLFTGSNTFQGTTTLSGAVNSSGINNYTGANNFALLNGDFVTGSTTYPATGAGLQAAISAAAGIGCVYAVRGTYTLTATLTFPSNSCIYWDNAKLISNGYNGDLVDVTSATNVVFRGKLLLDGTASGTGAVSHGLNVNLSTNFSFEDIEVNKTLNACVFFQGSAHVRGNRIYATNCDNGIGASSSGVIGGNSSTTPLTDVQIDTIDVNTTGNGTANDCVYFFGTTATQSTRIIIQKLDLQGCSDSAFEFNNTFNSHVGQIVVGANITNSGVLIRRGNTNINVNSVQCSSGLKICVDVANFGASDGAQNHITIGQVVATGENTDLTNGSAVRVSAGPTGAGLINDVAFGQIVADNSTRGFYCVGTSGQVNSHITVSSLITHNNKGDGYLAIFCNDLVLGEVIAFDNNIGGTTDEGDAIQLSTVLGFAAGNGRLYDDQGAGKTQKFGLSVNAASTNVTAGPFDCQDALEVTGCLSDGSALATVIRRKDTTNRIRLDTATLDVNGVIVLLGLNDFGAQSFGKTFEDINASNCTNGELALSAGWQSTGAATVTAVSGHGQTCSWTITTGTTTAANPTVTDTLTQSLGSGTTVCEMNVHGGTHTAAAGEGFTQTSLSATAPVFTFIGTPTAGNTTYFVTRRCGP